MKQLIYIGGWDCFRSDDDFCEALKNREYQPFQEKKSWKNRFKNKIKDEYETAFPTMPNIYNARYRAWKIWFEKIIPFLSGEKLVMIGHSLWAMFLAKYLSENIFPQKIAQLHMVSGCFDENDLLESWERDYLADFIFDPNTLKNIEQQVDKVFIYHSKDDTIVPFSHSEKYLSYLPHAMMNIFEDKGHFWSIEEFPELLENIKNIW